MDTRPNAHFNDEDSNTSANPAFEQIAQARMSRRGWLQGAASVGLASGASLAVPSAQAATPKAALSQLGFKAVGKSLADTVVVPEGYQAQVLYALGDPLNANVPAFKNDGSDGFTTSCPRPV